MDDLLHNLSRPTSHCSDGNPHENDACDDDVGGDNDCCGLPCSKLDVVLPEDVVDHHFSDVTMFLVGGETLKIFMIPTWAVHVFLPFINSALSFVAACRLFPKSNWFC